MAVSIKVGIRIFVVIIIILFGTHMLHPYVIPQPLMHKLIPSTKSDDMMNDETNLLRQKPNIPPQQTIDKRTMSTKTTKILTIEINFGGVQPEKTKLKKDNINPYENANLAKNENNFGKVPIRNAEMLKNNTNFRIANTENTKVANNTSSGIALPENNKILKNKTEPEDAIYRITKTSKNITNSGIVLSENTKVPKNETNFEETLSENTKTSRNDTNSGIALSESTKIQKNKTNSGETSPGNTKMSRNITNSGIALSDNTKMLNDSMNSGVKKIVLWNNFFRNGNWYMQFPGSGEKDIECSNRNKCILSVNRTSPLDYDAVVFHTRDPHYPPKVRFPSQIYIAFVYEAPVVPGRHYIKGNFYNWSATYYKKSDVTLQHGWWETLSKPVQNAIQSLPQYNKSRPNSTSTILWVVSHCGAISGRDKYVNELQRYMSVDIYGRCGKACPGGTKGNDVNCYDKLAKAGQYKFYLALENANCEDYISKKPYRGIIAKMVPIVFGGKNASDYVGLFPPNAYIDARNFTSPKHLAEYLKVLDRDDDKYFAYHAWRTDYAVFEGFGPSYCQICDALHNSKLAYPRTINWEEFWNPRKMCDSKLLMKLLG